MHHTFHTQSWEGTVCSTHVLFLLRRVALSPLPSKMQDLVHTLDMTQILGCRVLHMTGFDTLYTHVYMNGHIEVPTIFLKYAFLGGRGGWQRNGHWFVFPF